MNVQELNTTFFNHGLPLLSNSLDSGFMARDFCLQSLVFLQKVLDSNKVFSYEKRVRESGCFKKINSL